MCGRTVADILFLVVLFTCMMTSSNGKHLRIAWLIPNGQFHAHSNGESSVGALNLALSVVSKNDKILHGNTIVLKQFPIDCEITSIITTMMSVNRSYNPDVIIGPPCQSDFKTVGLLAAGWNLPVFSWHNIGSEFDNTTLYPTLIRLIPSTSILSTVLFDILKGSNERRITVVYHQSEPWSIVYEALIRHIDTHGALSMTSHPVRSGLTQPEIEALLGSMKENSSTIVLVCPSDNIRDIMLAARTLGMTNGSYSFIRLDPEIHSDNLLSDNGWKKGDRLDTKARIAYKFLTHIVIDPMYEASSPPTPTPSNRFDEFSRLIQTFKNVNNPNWSLTSVPGKPDVYSMFLYDTILLWSAVTDALMKAHANHRDGRLMAHTIRSFKAQGATGFISFNHNMDRHAKVFVLKMGSGGQFQPTTIYRTGDKGLEVFNLPFSHGKNQTLDLVSKSKKGESKAGINRSNISKHTYNENKRNANTSLGKELRPSTNHQIELTKNKVKPYTELSNKMKMKEQMATEGQTKALSNEQVKGEIRPANALHNQMQSISVEPISGKVIPKGFSTEVTHTDKSVREESRLPNNKSGAFIPIIKRKTGIVGMLKPRIDNVTTGISITRGKHDEQKHTKQQNPASKSTGEQRQSSRTKNNYENTDVTKEFDNKDVQFTPNGTSQQQQGKTVLDNDKMAETKNMKVKQRSDIPTRSAFEGMVNASSGTVGLGSSSARKTHDSHLHTPALQPTQPIIQSASNLPKSQITPADAAPTIVQSPSSSNALLTSKHNVSITLSSLNPSASITTLATPSSTHAATSTSASTTSTSAIVNGERSKPIFTNTSSSSAVSNLSNSPVTDISPSSSISTTPSGHNTSPTLVRTSQKQHTTQPRKREPEYVTRRHERARRNRNRWQQMMQERYESMMNSLIDELGLPDLDTQREMMSDYMAWSRRAYATTTNAITTTTTQPTTTLPITAPTTKPAISGRKKVVIIDTSKVVSGGAGSKYDNLVKRIAAKLLKHLTSNETKLTTTQPTTTTTRLFTATDYMPFEEPWWLSFWL